jgi:AhpD family alkylhydroperoxidase
MAHVPPLRVEDLSDLAPILEAVKARMGFVPNSVLTMAHMPQLPLAFALLGTSAFGADIRPLLALASQKAPEAGDPAENLSAELVQLIALAVSLSAGCRYCQAHTSHSDHRVGGDERKLANILRYRESAAFDDAERAALDLAFAAGRVPNESEASHFARLREHYNDRQIVQIVAVISLFGFLNRWNDTMATALESMPSEFASSHLNYLGWQAGKHT